jgi:hypothetical protein
MRKPRTVSKDRLRECWDVRLHLVERELLLRHAGLCSDEVARLARCDWQQLELDVEQLRKLFTAIRDLAQLGNELNYALAYLRGQH